MLHAGCGASSNSETQSLKSSFIGVGYFDCVDFGSLEKNNANATPMNAPNSVNDAFSNPTSNAPVKNMMMPTTVVLMLVNIRSIILCVLFAFQNIDFAMQISIFGL